MKINDTPAMGDFRIRTSRIANDFQTPLGVIISAGELLESYFERLSPERRGLALADILSAARQMNDALDLLLTCENRPQEVILKTAKARSRRREEAEFLEKPKLSASLPRRLRILKLVQET